MGGSACIHATIDREACLFEIARIVVAHYIRFEMNSYGRSM